MQHSDPRNPNPSFIMLDVDPHNETNPAVSTP